MNQMNTMSPAMIRLASESDQGQAYVGQSENVESQETEIPAPIMTLNTKIQFQHSSRSSVDQNYIHYKSRRNDYDSNRFNNRLNGTDRIMNL